ncbi:MAG: hypothetical protein LBE08_01805, partial [Bifidobacteriaceae bacterium]|nr:hypothetical protein [Bifidobacteriaceae bacterium]
FHEEYGGAVPQGPWAAQFKKISWPITHAVLPVYLQRHLARLLYDNRALSAQYVRNRVALGEQLAGHAGMYGTRSRQFCENTDLLGLVASSLLVGQEDESPFLSRSALDRLVSDVMSERHARAWLKNAQAASHVQALTGGRDPRFAGQTVQAQRGAGPGVTTMDADLPAETDESVGHLHQTDTCEPGSSTERGQPDGRCNVGDDD